MSNITLPDNSLTGCRVVPGGKTKQILSFSNYVNSPETVIIFPSIFSQTLHETIDIYFKLKNESFLSNH